MLSLLKRGLDAVVHPTIRLEASNQFPLTGKTLGVAYVVGFVLFIVGSLAPVIAYVGLVAALIYIGPPELSSRILDVMFQHDGQPKAITLALLMAMSFFGGFAAQMSYLSRLLRKRGYRLVDVVGLSTATMRGRNWLFTFWNIMWRAAVVWGAVIAFEQLLSLFVHAPDQPTIEYAKMLSGGSIWVFFVIAAIGAPLLEEFCFRGMLFQALRATFHQYVAHSATNTGTKTQRFLGKVVSTIGGADLASVAGSGAIFALWHLQFHPVQLLMLFIMGCVLAEVFRRSGTLWTSIALHALNNGFVALMLVIASS